MLIDTTEKLFAPAEASCSSEGQPLRAAKEDLDMDTADLVKSLHVFQDEPTDPHRAALMCEIARVVEAGMDEEVAGLVAHAAWVAGDL